MNERLKQAIYSVSDWQCYTPRDLEDYFPAECLSVSHCWLHTRKGEIAKVVISNGDDEFASHP